MLKNNIVLGELFNCGGVDVSITRYYDCKRITVKHEGTGISKDYTSRQISTGMVFNRLKRSVVGFGFIGLGKYSSADKSYSIWAAMIYRCYDHKAHKTHPYYKGCTVCEEWADFQEFSKWYYSQDNHSTKGYDIDKDSIKPGNKVYCPEYCSIITAKVNRSIPKAKRYSLISPSGERFDFINLAEFCREKGLTPQCISSIGVGGRIAHKGWTKV